MAFEIKRSQISESDFKQEFSTQDFAINDYQSEAIRFELPFGEIKGRQWIFDGIRMIYSEYHLNECAELEWKGDTEMITMHFNLKGKISLTDRETNQTFSLSNNQHNIFYGRKAEGSIHLSERKMKMFLVQFSKDAFFRVADNGNEAIKRFADAVAKGQPTAFSNQNLAIDLPLQQCIHSVMACPYSDPVKRMYLLSKSIEMLVLQAESLANHTNQKAVVLKTEYDKERILYARDYLIQRIDCPPSLIELAKEVGINEFKLKRGFKETFGVTAFQYLAEVRLERAKHDLLQERKSATEIAFQLGYSSLQHFSTAFKKKFGLSPNQVK